MKKHILMSIALFLLPMCSSKQAEEANKESKEPNTEWSKEMDELLEKAAALATLANTKQCVKSHDEMIAYLGTHQKRLEELATRLRKMEHTVPLKDKEAYEKKKASKFDKKMRETIATMAYFAKDCCNKELKHEDAWGLEEKLEFIRIIQSEK